MQQPLNRKVEEMSMNIEIQLFGAFRQYGDGSAIQVSVPEDSEVAGLRQAMHEQLADDNARALLRASAFATDERVLDETESVPAERNIAILPPVCGG